MKWTVTYRPSARDELAELWIAAANREAVAHAANEADRILSSEPLNAGESRDGPRRLMIVPPLAINFTVRPDDRIVIVWNVLAFEK